MFIAYKIEKGGASSPFFLEVKILCRVIILFIYLFIKVVMELVDMNSLGLFD